MTKRIRVLKEKRRQRILPYLVKLSKRGEATAKQIGSSPVEIARIRDEGLVKPVNQVSTGKRGRPALVYKLTDKGSKRVKRAIA